MIDARDVPIYVTNRDNLDRGFRRLLTWLCASGHENVTVIDNGSTWAPLLEFYDHSPELRVVPLAENLGPYAFWHLCYHTDQMTPFIVTDPDVVPSVACPRDLVARMLWAMENLPATPCKVGPSLQVDNLPSCYQLRDEVVAWEQQWWRLPTTGGVEGPIVAYDALIDTTFALYKPGSPSWPPEGTHYRLAPPYELEHVPWYEDSTRPTPEATYYREHIDTKWTHWTKLEGVVK